MGEDAPSASSLKPAVYAATFFSLVCVALNGAILGKGLNGDFATANTALRGGDSSSSIVTDDSSLSLSPATAGSQPIITDGNCLIDVRLQEEGETLDGTPGWFPENNVIVKLAGSECDVGVSPTWTVGDWDNTIVQIAPGATFVPPPLVANERHAIKLVRGTLIDVNYNGLFTNGHWETYVVSAPNRAAPLMIDSSKTEIKAGDDGAVIIYLKVTEEALKISVTSMDSGPVTKLAGPFFDKNRQWVKCSDYFGEDFASTEFYNYAGILIQENDESRLMYMQWWTLREDANADAYHKEHPNFGEMHMAYYTANGVSGMQTTLPYTENLKYKPNPVDAEGVHWWENDQTEVQIAIPWAPGVGHGPLWYVDPATGEPAKDCDGNMIYPFHRNLISANGEEQSPLRYTMWCAYEHPPEHVKVPLKMLTEWPNAYLQSEIDVACNGESERNQPIITEGECKVEVRLQEDGETLDGVPGWFTENNIVVKLPENCNDVAVSPTWTVGDWDNTIVQIAPDTVFNPPPLAPNERHAIKLVRGTLIDVNYNGIFTNGHWETFVVTAPNRAAPLMIDSSKTAILAGAEGAVIVYLKVTEDALKVSVTSMDSVPVTKLVGPYFDENRQWVKCSDYFGEVFEGTEFYNYAGILIQDEGSNRLMYMQWWTLREDADADAYHKEHPNFGEMHMAYYTANGVSGMQTTLPNTQNLNYQANPENATGVQWIENNQTEVQIAIPWAPGVGHGPLWSVDPMTGEPSRNCDGNMMYPFHRNLINDSAQDNEPLRFTMWCAYEHPPEHVKVPLSMLTEWPNAYLQTTMDPGQCGEATEGNTADGQGEVTGDGSAVEDSANTSDGSTNNSEGSGATGEASANESSNTFDRK